MNELQRQAYLRAMGIEVVYPRLPVAAARPSPHYDFPAYDFPAVVPAAASDRLPAAPMSSPGADASASTRARVVSELARSGTDSRPDKRHSAPSSSAATAAAATSRSEPPPAAGEEGEAELRFRLHYLPVNAALSVLWEVPLHAARDQERESRVLLNNILMALLAPLPETPPRVETFDWPIIEAASDLQAGARQAGQAVEGFMAMRRRRDGFKNLLVFASQVASLLPVLPGQGEHCDQYLDKLDCHLVCVSSLQAMLSVPSIKKEVWHHLQALRQRLAASTH